MRLISKIIATFLGIGFFPIAPGTLASAIVVLLYKLYLYKLSWPLYLTLLVFLFFAGTFSSTIYSSQVKKSDPRNIVIDEAVGQLLVFFRMSDMSQDWRFLLAGFFLFRVFDIIKPYPIRKVETLPKGWGIMLDDLVAAVYAGIVIQVYFLIKMR